MWGNGARSGTGIVHYQKDNLLHAKAPCLCGLPWGEEETRCCLISVHNRQYEKQQEAELKRQVWVADDLQTYSDSFTRVCSTPFETFRASNCNKYSVI